MAKKETSDGAEQPEMTELEQLELEERRHRVALMRDQVAKIEAKKDQELRNRRQQLLIEEKNKAKVSAEQNACAHKKAGRGIEGIFTGSAAEYAVIKHTEPWGETYVKCQRCGKEWRDPFFMLRKLDPRQVSNYKKANKTEYEQQMKDYKWAMELPTDNSPSGGTIFGIERDVEFAARA